MSNLNNILNKLGKIETIEQTNLAKHEVNLSVISDFTEAANKTIVKGDLLKKEGSELEGKLNQYFKLKNDLENQKKSLETNLKTIQARIDDINAGYNRTTKVYTEIVNKASELGFDYPKNIDSTMKRIEDLLSYSKSVSPKNVKL
jgi:chromosome segregation ATPase